MNPDSRNFVGPTVHPWRLNDPTLVQSDDGARAARRPSTSGSIGHQLSDETLRHEDFKEKAGSQDPSTYDTCSDPNAAAARAELFSWSMPTAYTFPGAPLQLDSPSTPFTPSLPTSSMVSPDMVSSSFDRASVATPSVFTSASSFTDDRPIHSPLMGEPGPDLRVSVDDVPSLTSTNSARTSAVQSYIGPYSNRPRSGEGVGVNPGITVRSGSMTSNATEDSSQITPRPAANKRSSLVSLSRLVGGSGSEKSKLSIEQKVPPESPEKGKSDKRGKGLSRIMRFLKPKPSNSP